jgi:hypothetical protein
MLSEVSARFSVLGMTDSVQSGFLAALLVFAAVSISLLLVRRKYARTTSNRETGRDAVERIKDTQRIRDVADDLLVRLEQVAREVNAELDTKFTRLECVVRDADDRIARLQHLLAQVSAETSQGPELKTQDSARSESAITTPPPVKAASVSKRSTVDQSRQHRRAVNSTENSGQSDERAPAGSEASGARQRPTDPHRQRVYDMFDAGRPLIQIAEALDLPLGEVELILNLREMK